MTIIGYARVSTQDQDLAGQIEKLTAAGCERIFHEKVSGGRKDNRPELGALLETISRGDTLIVTRLDRLARSTYDLWTILRALDQCGASFKSLNESWADTTTAHGRLIVTIFAGVAEFERELIKARCDEGRARARATGKKLGGPKPKLDVTQIAEARDKLALGKSFVDVADDYGVSRDTIKRLCA